MNTINFLLCGVGGQGVLLASTILAKAALRQGLDVKGGEVHGMAQRGGAVVSHMRIGDKVYSPLVPLGQCDFLVGFEPLEAARNAHWVRPSGLLLYSTYRVNPSTVAAGLAEYPEDLERQLEGFPCRKRMVPASDLARQAGDIRAANAVMAGALSRHLEFPLEVWEEAVAESVPPKVLEINRVAFRLGREAGG
jgi:indolepyruvate ferredoxin oxidoreductase, beta subunit